jgi:hypothetical protein
MEGTVANFEALAEITVFLSFFKDLPDRRQPGKVFICFEMTRRASDSSV